MMACPAKTPFATVLNGTLTFFQGCIETEEDTIDATKRLRTTINTTMAESLVSGAAT